jgi:hypothetical protein
MTAQRYEYQSDFVRRYVFHGRAEAKAGAVLAILDIRGISVTDEARARITGCTDLDQLDTWVRRAVTTDSVDHLVGVDTGHRTEATAAWSFWYKGTLVGRFVAQGRVEGLADAVFAILETRRIPIPDETRTGIMGCADLDQLGALVQRAATSTSVDWSPNTSTDRPSAASDGAFLSRYIYQGRADGRQESWDVGRAEGGAAALLVILEARGVPVPDEVRGRITECTDLVQLDNWIRRAATADSMDDLFIDA